MSEPERGGDLKVVQFPLGSLADIPARAEELATNIRAGKYGKPTAAVCVLLGEDGAPTIFGWGSDADPTRAIGILTIAANWLASREAGR